eukprot:jgi/Mesen1/8815/ME000053S08218
MAACIAACPSVSVENFMCSKILSSAEHRHSIGRVNGLFLKPAFPSLKSEAPILKHKGFSIQRFSTRAVATAPADLNVVEDEEESVIDNAEDEVEEEGGAIAPSADEVGKFKLHVKRDVGSRRKKAMAAEAALQAPPVPSKPIYESLPAAPPAPAAKSSPSPYDSDEEEVDEGLLYVTAPKVGVFRRGRSAKGKQGKPLVVEEGQVKKGQVVCYLEQLGTQLAIESEHTGEVVSVFLEDGDPVGYAERLIAIRPAFPGIKKLY